LKSIQTATVSERPPAIVPTKTWIPNWIQGLATFTY
jgi:hypothetical protein